jgi:[acyl-carrier-protein] S-malonyltransferase
MNKFAFFFPGQGSQSVGMMAGFANAAVVKNTFIEASDLLGIDFWRMATEANDAINETTNTQPMMLVAGVATLRAWQAHSQQKPAMLAGHSLGEYTALVASGALTFADALPLVKFRAEVMQKAVPVGTGAMAAILGLEDDMIVSLCAEAQGDEVLQAVNFNSPGQVVIAGNVAAVERGMALAKEKGAKRAVSLPVSVPSHCLLMKPAADEMAQYLLDINVDTPNIPVLHNSDVASYDNAEQIKDALVRQLYNPVRWVETVKAIHEAGINQSAECGPGKVLTTLTKRIVADLSCTALISQEALDAFASNE